VWGSAKGGVSGDGFLIASDGIGDLTAEQQLVSGVERKSCLLAADGAAGQIRTLAAILGGLRAQLLTWARKLNRLWAGRRPHRLRRLPQLRRRLVREHAGQRDARTGLAGQKRDGLLPGLARFVQTRILFEVLPRMAQASPFSGRRATAFFSSTTA